MRSKHLLSHWDFNIVTEAYPDWYRWKLPCHTDRTLEGFASEKLNQMCFTGVEDEVTGSIILKAPDLSLPDLAPRLLIARCISRQETEEYSGNGKKQPPKALYNLNPPKKTSKSPPELPTVHPKSPSPTQPITPLMWAHSQGGLGWQVARPDQTHTNWSKKEHLKTWRKQNSGRRKNFNKY